MEIEGDYYQGTVKSIPVEPTIPNYQISFPDSPQSLEVPLNQLTAPNEPVFQLIEADQTIADEAFPSLPKWIPNPLSRGRTAKRHHLIHQPRMGV